MGKSLPEADDRAAEVEALFVTVSDETSADYRRDFPETWHGGPSRAERVLLPLGLSAARFVAADDVLRDLALSAIVAEHRRRLLSRAALYVVLMLGTLLLLTDQWRILGFGGVALKAGADLGRFRGLSRTIEAARSIGVADLEVVKPAE